MVVDHYSALSEDIFSQYVVELANFLVLLVQIEILLVREFFDS